MPSRSRLTEKEKGKIDLSTIKNHSNRKIAKQIKRAPTLVNNYINLNENNGLKRYPGRKPKITGVLKKRIIHLANKEMMSASKIKTKLILTHSTRTNQ